MICSWRGLLVSSSLWWDLKSTKHPCEMIIGIIVLYISCHSHGNNYWPDTWRYSFGGHGVNSVWSSPHCITRTFWPFFHHFTGTEGDTKSSFACSILGKFTLCGCSQNESVDGCEQQLRVFLRVRPFSKEELNNNEDQVCVCWPWCFTVCLNCWLVLGTVQTVPFCCFPLLWKKLHTKLSTLCFAFIRVV